MSVDIGIRIKADNMTGRDFDKLVGDLKRTGTTTEQVSRSAKGFGNRLGDMRSQLRNVALGAGAFTAALGLVGKSFVSAAIEMEGIKNGMVALEGSTEAAEARLSSLREVIRQPGVGYQDAVKAAVQLKAVNLEAELANRTIREFGNSLALVGSTDLNETLLGVRQILSRGLVSQEELNQITERSALIATVLRDQFGSVLAEDIQAQIDQAGKSITDGFLIPLLEGLERLDRAPVDSTMNSIQNLHNSVFELKASLGDALLPVVNSIVQVLTSAVETFNEMDDGVKSAIVTVGAIATGLGALATAASAVGYVLGGLKALLATLTGAGGLAGLGALLAPAAPVLAGLAALVVSFIPLIKSLKDAEEATRLVREQEELFAKQLKDTAEVLESGKGVDARIAKLNEYISTLDEVIRKEQERREKVEKGLAIQTIPRDEMVAALAEQAIGPRDPEDSIGAKEKNAIRNREDAESILAILKQIRDGTKLTIEQLREFDSVVVRAKNRALKEKDPNQDLLKTLEAAGEYVRKQYEQFEAAAQASGKAIVPLRNYRLEIVNLNNELVKARDVFSSDVTNLTELESATQNLLSALDALKQVKLKQIEEQLKVAGLALSELPNDKRATSEEAKKVIELTAQYREEENNFERQKTEVQRQEAQKRKRFNDEEERAREDRQKREAAKSAVPVRNFRLELVKANAELYKARDNFRKIIDVSELDSATSILYSALDAVKELKIAQIKDQIVDEKEAFSQLSESDKVLDEAAHVKKIMDLEADLHQLEVNNEQEKTRVKEQEEQKRTQFEKDAARARKAILDRETAERLKAHNAFYGENGVLKRTLQSIADLNEPQRFFDFKQIAARNRRAAIERVFEGYITRDVEPHEALKRAQNFVALTDGIGNNLKKLEINARVFKNVFKREFNETLLGGAKAYGKFVKSLSEPSPDELAAEAAKKAAREALLNRLSEGTGNLVGSVPLDVVDAVTSSLKLRRDGNAEIIQLERETAAEIQSIQESVTLSAEEKAREIERIERQSALRRIQIENQVSELQRASFQSVVTDFLTGIARMIAAEAQLALARRATSAISGLFGGGGAAAGVGLLGGVFLPLLGGLGLAYGASQLIGHASPSAEVHQRSRYGAVSGSGGDRTPTVQSSRGQTRVSREDGTPTLEANLNVTVEASGTRLGQANERVKLKTERWGG